MGKYGTFEMGVDMPGGYWEKEFSDRGLASDLFTLLGGGLSHVSDVNRKEKARKEEMALKQQQFMAEMGLADRKLAQDEDQFGRKLESEEWQAGLKYDNEEGYTLWDPERGVEVPGEPEAPGGPVANIPAAGAPRPVQQANEGG